MAHETSLLIPEFRKKLNEVIESCKKRCVRIEVIRTLITPMEQASLWREGRSATEAELKIMALENIGAHYLAKCLRKTVANATNIVTDALPGNSWHQWAEAAYCVWIDSNHKVNHNAKAIDTPQGFNGYRILGEECAKMGLTKDEVGTVQLRSQLSPMDVFTLVEINNEMLRRFNR